MELVQFTTLKNNDAIEKITRSFLSKNRSSELKNEKK